VIAAPLLQLTSVTKSFGAVRALKVGSFDLRAGAPGQPGGLPAISRGLSAATPPEPGPLTSRTPAGCQSRPVVRALNQHRESPALHQGAFQLPLLTGGYRLATRSSTLGHGLGTFPVPLRRVADANCL
jgi:hypothetical protein